MVQLRDYQIETIDRTINNFLENKKRNLCVLATGLGKTVIATEIHKRFKPDEKTLFLVDRKELAIQARDSFQRADPSLRVGIEMNIYESDRRDNVVVASVQTLGRVGSKRIKKFNPDQFTKIIVDEAHTSITESAVRVLSYLGVGPTNNAGNKLLVGLTATPNRTDGFSLGTLYDDIVVNYDLVYGITNGWLTDIEIIDIETNVDISDVKSSKMDFDERDLAQKINIANRNALIIKSYLENSKDEQALVYCSNVDHALQVAALFEEHDIPAACIHANTDEDDRRQYVEDYKRGRIKVLTNYGTLTTGFDAPETSTIILARPLKSELLLRQIIGRGLRPSQLSFIDLFKTKEERLAIINSSMKSVCKVIDLHDIVGDHDIVSVPSLFGLNSKIKGAGNKKLYKDVVEPLEEIKREHQIDISKITSLDDVSMIVKRKKIDFASINIPKEVSKHTNRPWMETGNESYEIFYHEDKKSLSVERNTIDRWDLVLHDNKNKISKKLNEFYDLSGAIKVGDQYADKNLTVQEHVTNDKWRGRGVTKAQFDFLVKRLKGGLKVERYKTYTDTGIPILQYRKTGEILNAGSASNLITILLNKK